MRLRNLLRRVLDMFKRKYHSNTTETPGIGESRGVRHTGIRGVNRVIASNNSNNSRPGLNLAYND